MGSAMSIDNQDLVGKMEGFAIQGMKGIYSVVFLHSTY
jgi:hypothetical protein